MYSFRTLLQTLIMFQLCRHNDTTKKQRTFSGCTISVWKIRLYWRLSKQPFYSDLTAFHNWQCVNSSKKLVLRNDKLKLFYSLFTALPRRYPGLSRPSFAHHYRHSSSKRPKLTLTREGGTFCRSGVKFSFSVDKDCINKAAQPDFWFKASLHNYGNSWPICPNLQSSSEIKLKISEKIIRLSSWP